MSNVARDNRQPTSEAEIEAYTIGGAQRLDGPVRLVEYDPAWPQLFAREAARIKRLLGETAKSI